MLRSWRRADPNPCGWTGITCHFPDLRVRSMSALRALSSLLFLPLLCPLLLVSNVVSTPSQKSALYATRRHHLSQHRQAPEAPQTVRLHLFHHLFGKYELKVSSFAGLHVGLLRALHQNSLHGPIPAEIRNCTELRALYALSISFLFSSFYYYYYYLFRFGTSLLIVYISCIPLFDQVSES